MNGAAPGAAPPPQTEERKHYWGQNHALTIQWLRGAGYEDAADALLALHADDLALMGIHPYPYPEALRGAPSGPSRLPQHLFVHEQCQRCDSTDTVLVPLCREHYVGPAEVAGGPSRLRALLVDWLARAEALENEVIDIKNDPGSHFYRNGQRWSLRRCAAELEALVGPVPVETTPKP